MRIGILGHFGDGVTMLNGQTVKTKNLVDGLTKYTDSKIIKIDSHGWIKRPLVLIKSIKKAFQECDAIIMLPAQNGVQVFSPVLLHYKKKYHKKIFYDVIGGWLPEFLCGKKRLSHTLKRFDGIWVETDTMKNKLTDQGFNNLSVVPNFKDLQALTEAELVIPAGTPYRLCTFSRVMKEKGIEDAVNAVKAVNSSLGYTAFTLDIYGQIDQNQTEWFDLLQNAFPTYISYQGYVDANKSVEVLKNYFALLFPTYYEGEGFAGTLIDAFSAGVPVIATDWRYNKELITDQIGFIYPTGQQEMLIEILKRTATEPVILLDKKTNCIRESEKYQCKQVVQNLLYEMDRKTTCELL